MAAGGSCEVDPVILVDAALDLMPRSEKTPVVADVAEVNGSAS